MTRRLLLSYIGLAILILAVLEAPLGILTAGHERGLAAESAERTAAGLAVSVGEAIERNNAADLVSLVDRYRSQTGGEVTIVDPSGRILARSDTDRDSDRGASDLAMVQAALSGRPVDAFTSDEGHPWAQAAVPIAGEGQPAGAVLLGFSAAGAENRVHEVWVALAVLGLGLLALTAGVGVLLARSLTRPLAVLEEAVATVASGRLDARAYIKGPPEMRAVAEQFNEMAARLSDLIGAQSRFVADASHQLRSPLTALRLRLENMEVASAPAEAAGFAALTCEVQRLSRIVDGLLTLGRAEGERPTEREPIDVASVIEDRCDAWAALADERGIVLTASVERHVGAVVAVPGDLDQMLDNLMANAIDAMGNEGRLTISAQPQRGGFVEIHVEDDGPGMTAEERARAFDRFWQGTKGQTGHSGLGLAIVHQLAVRNLGEVELRPAHPSGLDAVITLRSGGSASRIVPAGASRER